jgi:hypothetical protein
VQIDARNLLALPLANSDRIEVAQKVWALGFPLASLLGENLKATDGTVNGINQNEGRKQIQVNASINPGNSGGPLISETGAVLGVNSAKLTGEAITNVGFATPINEAKRLLTGKGIAFQSGEGAGKLEGPTLVKQVSPAVALITVTIIHQPDDTYKVNCRSSLGQRKQPKQGGAVGAVNIPVPAFGGTDIEMDGSGGIQNAKPNIPLPFLLGDLGLLFIEPLPPDNRGTWRSSSTFTLTLGKSSNAGGLPFGPRAAIPRPRIGGPPGRPPIGPVGRPGQTQTETVTLPAREQIDYTRGQPVGDTVTIQKRSTLKTDPGAAVSLSLIGEGPITFDLKNGMPRSIDFKGTLLAVQGNSTTRIPVTVTCKLVEGAERDRVLTPPPAPPPAKVEVPPPVQQKPLTDADVDPILADLRGPDRTRRRLALERLAQSQPTARRAEVARAIEAVLADNSDTFVHPTAAKALGVWGTPESVPLLINLVEHQNVFLRREAITALGKLKDERAAEPVARRLTDFGDRGSVIKALQELGPKAEKAVLPYLQHQDLFLRLEVCKVLKVIGTKESIPALEAATRDSNRGFANEAKAALDAVKNRP